MILLINQKIFMTAKKNVKLKFYYYYDDDDKVMKN